MNTNDNKLMCRDVKQAIQDYPWMNYLQINPYGEILLTNDFHVLNMKIVLSVVWNSDHTQVYSGDITLYSDYWPDDVSPKDATGINQWINRLVIEYIQKGD